MGDDKLSAQAATDAKLREAQKKQGASGSGNGRIDVGKHLIMGSPDKSLNKPSIAELARPAFEKAKAEEPSIAELARPAFEKAKKKPYDQSLRGTVEVYATYEYEKLLDEIVTSQGGDKPQSKIDFQKQTLRTDIVGYTADRKSVTHKEQWISDRTSQLLEQQRERVKQKEREKKYETMTAEKSFNDIGVYGDLFT